MQEREVLEIARKDPNPRTDDGRLNNQCNGYQKRKKD